MIGLMGMGRTVSLPYPNAVVTPFPAVLDWTDPSGFPGAAVYSVAATMLSVSVVINFFLAAFNMIPIPPLDGSWVLEHLFPNSLGRFYARIRPFGFLLFIFLLMSNTLHILLAPVLIVLFGAIQLVSASSLFG